MSFFSKKTFNAYLIYHLVIDFFFFCFGIFSCYAIDTFKDKYGTNHDVFFNFELKVPQRACTPAQMPKFKNIKADKVNILPAFDAKKNLWILKPSWMSRGRGLELFTELKQLEQFLQMYIGGYDAKDYKQMKYSPTVERSPSISVGKTRASSRPAHNPRAERHVSEARLRRGSDNSSQGRRVFFDQ